jgi:hypothetical protein
MLPTEFIKLCTSSLWLYGNGGGNSGNGSGGDKNNQLKCPKCDEPCKRIGPSTIDEGNFVNTI